MTFDIIILVQCEQLISTGAPSPSHQGWDITMKLMLLQNTRMYLCVKMLVINMRAGTFPTLAYSLLSKT